MDCAANAPDLEHIIPARIQTSLPQSDAIATVSNPGPHVLRLGDGTFREIWYLDEAEMRALPRNNLQGSRNKDQTTDEHLRQR
jgi:hypothetical protein